MFYYYKVVNINGTMYVQLESIYFLVSFLLITCFVESVEIVQNTSWSVLSEFLAPNVKYYFIYFSKLFMFLLHR